jgi:hypothetical protein
VADITDGRAVIGAAFWTRAFAAWSLVLPRRCLNTKPDGRFHRITVRVKRPGVQMRARSGYLAASAAEPAAHLGVVARRGRGATRDAR